jgi:hypothetical protein
MKEVANLMNVNGAKLLFGNALPVGPSRKVS